MLLAASQSSFSNASFVTRLAVDRNVRVFASSRRNLQYTSKLVPSARERERPIMQLCCVLEGRVRVRTKHGEFTVDAPQVARFPESWDKGANGRRDIEIETSGAEVRAIHIHYRTGQRRAADGRRGRWPTRRRRTP